MGCHTVPAVLERFGSDARAIVDLAEDEARRLGHGHVGTEHLLLGMLAAGESTAARALLASGATLEGARQVVAEAVPVDAGGIAGGKLQLTDRARRVVERAARLALRQHDDQVDSEHVLLSLLDVEGTAGQVLRGLGIDLAWLRAAVESMPERGLAAEGASPRCAECGAPLETTLAHRVLASRGEAGQPRELLVAYCSGCGSALAASAL